MVTKEIPKMQDCKMPDSFNESTKQTYERINNLIHIIFKINEKIDKSEEQIKSLEEIVTKQSNANTQILIKLVKLDEYNEELSERIKSLEGGCKCKGNDNTELEQLRKENKELKQELARLRTFAKNLLSCVE